MHQKRKGQEGKRYRGEGKWDGGRKAGDGKKTERKEKGEGRLPSHTILAPDYPSLHLHVHP